jgi:hypothetical protein
LPLGQVSILEVFFVKLQKWPILFGFFHSKSCALILTKKKQVGLNFLQTHLVALLICEHGLAATLFVYSLARIIYQRRPCAVRYSPS